MIRLFACIFLLLTGCYYPNAKDEWRCIGGLTYMKVNGTWVQIDGHFYVSFKDGPIKCDEDSTAQREAGT